MRPSGRMPNLPSAIAEAYDEARREQDLPASSRCHCFHSTVCSAVFAEYVVVNDLRMEKLTTCSGRNDQAEMRRSVDQRYLDNTGLMLSISSLFDSSSLRRLRRTLGNILRLPRSIRYKLSYCRVPEDARCEQPPVGTPVALDVLSDNHLDAMRKLSRY